MSEHDTGSMDAWARWLLEGRDAHMPSEQRAATRHWLHEIRDKVLGGARINPGDRILDVGAGTGLLAIEASRHVGVSHGIVALDISHSALRLCRDEADRVAQIAHLHPVAGDAVRLPFPDQSFDVVVARSVLIYVNDKRAAIDEMFRVLRDAGRLSFFEPINAAGRRYGIDDDAGVPAELRPDHDAVRALFRARSAHWQPMTDFDERDLVRHLIAAGFDAVGLRYELLYMRARASIDELTRLLDQRGNPTAPTWREAAVEALGTEHAETYLRALIDARARHARTDLTAHAYVTATRTDTTRPVPH